MAGEIELVTNYTDQSTENGFQYEFSAKFCAQCDTKVG
jgi:hypothetical protein